MFQLPSNDRAALRSSASGIFEDLLAVRRTEIVLGRERIINAGVLDR